jgi:uncharacterized membrane protein
MAKTIRPPLKKASFGAQVLQNKKVIFFFLAFALIGVFYVLIRMKGVEQDYALNQIQKKFDRASLENKELKAMKANQLSVKNLRGISDKYLLTEPDQNQIIVIPE